ncbi:MAG: helix-hairpin-helix domain-containing protein [Chitinophagaceae bacterium]
MKTKQNLSEYFQFSRKDRIAVLIIASILLTAFLLPTLLEGSVSPPRPTADTAWTSALKKLEKPVPEAVSPAETGQRSIGKYRYDQPADNYNNEPQAQLFSFDPNTLDDAGWKKLGVKGKTIATIRKYLDKGGRFKKVDDLQKIYGMRPDLAARLIPYVRIHSSGNSVVPQPVSHSAEQEKFRGPRKIVSVDINTSDSATLESLAGIGPTLAARIVRFREKLGGFYDVKQVSETFGLRDSLFTAIEPQIFIQNKQVKQLNINTSGIEELKNHPYIRYPLAKLIVSYRQEHGSFSDITQLKKVHVIDPVLFEKIKPYLTVE